MLHRSSDIKFINDCFNSLDAFGDKNISKIKRYMDLPSNIEKYSIKYRFTLNFFFNCSITFIFFFIDISLFLI